MEKFIMVQMMVLEQLLEIAQAFQMAKKAGNGPKRSILFLHVTGEEHGLHGSRYYSENPLFPMPIL
jgi:Zn-dependent M28 family amino/carboxypeptidase